MTQLVSKGAQGTRCGRHPRTGSAWRVHRSTQLAGTYLRAIHLKPYNPQQEQERTVCAALRLQRGAEAATHLLHLDPVVLAVQLETALHADGHPVGLGLPLPPLVGAERDLLRGAWDRVWYGTKVGTSRLGWRDRSYVSMVAPCRSGGLRPRLS
jgi:hypothetical protein